MYKNLLEIFTKNSDFWNIETISPHHSQAENTIILHCLHESMQTIFWKNALKFNKKHYICQRMNDKTCRIIPYH